MASVLGCCEIWRNPGNVTFLGFFLVKLPFKWLSHLQLQDVKRSRLESPGYILHTCICLIHGTEHLTVASTMRGVFMCFWGEQFHF